MSNNAVNSSSNANDSGVLPRSHSPAHTNVDPIPPLLVHQPLTRFEQLIISLDTLLFPLASYLILYLMTRIIYTSDEGAMVPYLWAYLVMICTSALTVCGNVLAGAAGRSDQAILFTQFAQIFYAFEVLGLGSILVKDNGDAWSGNGSHYVFGIVIIGFVAGMVCLIDKVYLEARESAEGKKGREKIGYLLFYIQRKIRDCFFRARRDEARELQGNQPDGSSSGKVFCWPSRLGLTSSQLQEHEQAKLLDDDSVDTLV